MAEFKIGLGLEIEQEDKVAVQKIIDDIRAEKPEIKIKVNTEQALKNIKDLQKELKKLKDVKININTGSSTKKANKKDNIVKDLPSTDTNNVSWKSINNNSSEKRRRKSDFNEEEAEAEQLTFVYKELLNVVNRLGKLKKNHIKLNPADNARELLVIEDEAKRLESVIERIKQSSDNPNALMDLPKVRDLLLDISFEVNKIKASMDDASEVKNLNHEYDTLKKTLEEIGRTRVALAKLNDVEDANYAKYLNKREKELQEDYDKRLNSIGHKLSAEQKIEISNIGASNDVKVREANIKKADAQRKLAEKLNAKDVEDSYKEVSRLGNVIDKLKTKITSLSPIDDELQLEVLTKLLNDVEKEYNDLISAISRDLSDEQLKKIQKQADETAKHIEIIEAKLIDTELNQIKKDEVKQNNANFKDLEKLGNSIDKVREKLAKLDTTENSNEIKVLTKQLNELEKEYKELFATFSKDLSSEQFEELWIKAEKATEKLDVINAQILDKQISKYKKITSQFSVSQGGTGGFDTDISNLTTRISKLSNVSDEVKADMTQLRALIDVMVEADDIGDIDRLISSYNEYNDVVKKVKNSLKDLENKQRIDLNSSNLEFDKQKLSNDINIWLQKNSASAKEFGAILENIKAQIQSADRIKLDGLRKEFRQATQEAELAGKTGLTFGDTLKKQWEQMRGYFTLYDVYSYAKQGITSMFQEVNKVDMAMSGLYRVTDLTTTQYQEMYNGMTESAKRYGLVLSELIDGATTWAKLGFSGTQASELGEISGRYQVVADTDAETAVTNLVTAYNGFKDELLNLYDGDDIKAVEYVSDIFNKLGNEYAIDAESIGVALTKSASALSVAGNDIQQASGMITGIAEKTGNAERGSNALKILSLRLRGMTGELEELGEEVDENVVSISAMQTKILNLTGGKVNIFKDDGSFKSTYDIMKEISEIYYDLSDINRASLLETIAGKFLPEYIEMCI